MLGAEENYFAGRAIVAADGIDGFGGIFLGRACDIAPMENIDPDVAKYIGGVPFYGGYAYLEAYIPIPSPLFCLLEANVGMGYGAFVFNDGPLYGGRISIAGGGTALCSISVKGEAELLGLTKGDGLVFEGRGRFDGKAGKCPFCLTFDEKVKFTYSDGDWDIDY
jgi:hypothetical protein